MIIHKLFFTTISEYYYKIVNLLILIRSIIITGMSYAALSRMEAIII